MTKKFLMLLSLCFFATCEQAGAATDLTSFEKLPKDPAGVKLKIKVPSNGCIISDWDVITMERENSDNKRLLLSIEALGDASVKPVVKEITNFDLTKGFVSTLSLPSTAAATPLAIYICKDTENSGKCTGKEAKDINTVAKAYSAPLPVDPRNNNLPEMPKPPKATDKIYYFGYLVVDKSTVYSLKSEAMKDQATVNADLKKLGVAKTEQAFAELKKLDAEIRSEQPALEEGALTINLPHMDPAACIPKS